MRPCRTDKSAVRCSLSSPFIIPHASPSEIDHPCCSHFHLEHERKQVFASRRIPCPFGCLVSSRSNSASSRSSCSSGVTIPPLYDVERHLHFLRHSWKRSRNNRPAHDAQLRPALGQGLLAGSHEFRRVSRLIAGGFHLLIGSFLIDLVGGNGPIGQQ